MKKIKILIGLLIILSFLISVFAVLALGYSLFTNKEMCVDTGICPEGVKFKGYVITKDYCQKNNYKWDNENKTCNLREK